MNKCFQILCDSLKGEFWGKINISWGQVFNGLRKKNGIKNQPKVLKRQKLFHLCSIKHNGVIKRLMFLPPTPTPPHTIIFPKDPHNFSFSLIPMNKQGGIKNTQRKIPNVLQKKIRTRSFTPFASAINDPSQKYCYILLRTTRGGKTVNLLICGKPGDRLQPFANVWRAKFLIGGYC